MSVEEGPYVQGRAEKARACSTPGGPEDAGWMEFSPFLPENILVFYYQVFPLLMGILMP